jgi:hypothetical protein
MNRMTGGRADSPRGAIIRPMIMPRRRATRVVGITLVAASLAAVLSVGAVWTNAFGAGDRFDGLVARIELFLDPPPDRPTRPTVAVTPRPSPTVAPTAGPTPSEGPSADPSAAPTLEPTPTPTPARVPVDVDLLSAPGVFFNSQVDSEWCAAAGTQIVLAVLGLADTSDDFQRALVDRIGEWESWADSHNGGWGPAAISLALEAYGAPGYEIHAYETRDDALRGAAVAIDVTGAPVVLLTWRGAHTWVMTGYRANADPAIFPDALVTGTYILDPWYPRESSIWGLSDEPGVFQDRAEMERNFLPWKRPEGIYPDRDGRFIVVVPTIPVSRG